MYSNILFVTGYIRQPYITQHIRLLNKGKRKGRFYSSAIYYACIVSKSSNMDHTDLPANTMPACPS